MTNKNSLIQIVHYQVLNFVQFSHLWENQVGKLLVTTYCISHKATTHYQTLSIQYIIEKY